MGKSSVNCPIEWFPLDGFPNYEINRKGIIRNAKSGRPIKYQKDGRSGKLSAILNDATGKQRKIQIADIVAHYFLNNNNLPRNPMLKHLDGDNTNCSADNLEWVEEDICQERFYSEVGQHKPKDYFIFYPLIEFPDSIYEINKVGQIRNKNTLKLVKGAIRNGYKVYTLRINNKDVCRSAHILV